MHSDISRPIQSVQQISNISTKTIFNNITGFFAQTAKDDVDIKQLFDRHVPKNFHGNLAERTGGEGNKEVKMVYKRLLQDTRGSFENLDRFIKKINDATQTNGGSILLATFALNEAEIVVKKLKSNQPDLLKAENWECSAKNKG